MEYATGVCGRLPLVNCGRSGGGAPESAGDVPQYYAQEQKYQERDEELANEGGDHVVGAGTVAASPG
jgi:hypothetical protein